MKTRVCDICDRPMDKTLDSEQYFKVKCEGILGYYYKMDVCQGCFERFKEFVNNEKNDKVVMKKKE